MEKRYFDDAGLVFTQCGEHAKALLAYRESVNWQMALCSAGNLEFTKKDTMSLCEELSSKYLKLPIIRILSLRWFFHSVYGYLLLNAFFFNSMVQCEKISKLD